MRTPQESEIHYMFLCNQKKPECCRSLACGYACKHTENELYSKYKTHVQFEEAKIDPETMSIYFFEVPRVDPLGGE